MPGDDDREILDYATPESRPHRRPADYYREPPGGMLAWGWAEWITAVVSFPLILGGLLWLLSGWLKVPWK